MNGFIRVFLKGGHGEADEGRGHKTRVVKFFSRIGSNIK